MTQVTADNGNIRFPDGRVVRATSMGLIRQQLGAGRIPANCTSAVIPTKVAITEWTKEFADLAGGSARHEPVAAAGSGPPNGAGAAS